jgi:hypothetical protein
MKKVYLLLLTMFLILGTGELRAQGKKYLICGVGFYNLENLFDTQHDVGKNDYEYLPDGTNKWSELKYSHKLRNMAKVLSEMGTEGLPNVGCAAIGVAEVENSRCLTDLCNQPPLKARNFQFVHVEGPDQRGIDCALLYNPSLFTVCNYNLVPYVYKLPKDSARATRGFLVVNGVLEGEDVAIIVCHLPSRGSESYYREEGGRQLRVVKDQLQARNPDVKILIMGDMNDDPQDKSMAVALGAKRKISEVGEGGLYNPWWDMLASGTGTLLYDGKWNLFDQIIVSQNLLNNEEDNDYSTLKLGKHQIFRRDYLFQKEGKYKGNTLRTHAGGVWLDGYSDHLPTIVYLMKEQKK